MSIDIAGFEFEEPYRTTRKLKDERGIFAIVCLRDDDLFLIDIDESNKVKTAVENHDRQDCWRSNCSGTLGVAVRYTRLPQRDRRDIGREIRDHYGTIPCGGVLLDKE